LKFIRTLRQNATYLLRDNYPTGWEKLGEMYSKTGGDHRQASYSDIPFAVFNGNNRVGTASRAFGQLLLGHLAFPAPKRNLLPDLIEECVEFLP
jgi:hypothetical protein